MPALIGHAAVYVSIRDKMHLYDLQATLLHLLGLDHEQLTFPYAGLTDVYGQVAHEILA